MKKNYLTFLALLFSVAVFSQTPDKKWAIGFGPGVYYNLDIEKIGFIPELYLSRYLNSSFDLMLKSNLGLWGDGNNKGIDIAGSFLNLRYKLYNDKIFSTDSKIQPYLYGGPGYLADNQSDGMSFDAGIGSKFPIGSSTSLYLEAGYINGIDYKESGTNVKENFLKLTGIIEFAFGKQKDSDGDGVADKNDECANTPPGVIVDAKGCPVDSDSDGIADYKDDCPNETGELRLNGCPDKDGDGIPDKDDMCADIPGLKKFKGCPDSDNDGVMDSKDNCPNSPEGCSVDAQGCPVDSDKDGVIDCEDNCPTVAGPVDNKGCPVEVETTFGPIYFDLNKDILKPDAKLVLNEVVESINQGKGYDIVIAGHACDLGPETFNQDLSERRAKAVVKYLIRKGVNNVYVGSKGYGEYRPAVPNTSESNRQKNRRAELMIEFK